MNFLESRLAYFEESFESRNSTSSKEITPDQKVQIVNYVKSLPDIKSVNKKINEICVLYPSLGKGERCIKILGLTEFYNTLKNKNNTGSVVDTNKNLTPILLNEKNKNNNTSILPSSIAKVSTIPNTTPSVSDNSNLIRKKMIEAKVTGDIPKIKLNLKNSKMIGFDINNIKKTDFDLKQVVVFDKFINEVIYKNDFLTEISFFTMLNRIEEYLGFPKDILFAIGCNESLWDINADDKKNSIGAMQIHGVNVNPTKSEGPLGLTKQAIERKNTLQSILRAVELLYSYKAYFYKQTVPKSQRPSIGFQDIFRKNLDPNVKNYATNLEDFKKILLAYNDGVSAVKNKKENNYPDVILTTHRLVQKLPKELSTENNSSQ